MKMLLKSAPSSLESTIGDLYIDGAHECVTLELPWRQNRPQVSCIPAGTYQIGFKFSPHLGYRVPLVLGVPDRSEIEMHIANSAKDIRGCIGVGLTKGTDWINSSASAFKVLMAKLEAAEAAGQPITLEVVRAWCQA